MNCIHSPTVVSLLEYCNASHCLVVLYCIIGGGIVGREAFSFAFFSVLCPVRFPIPEIIRNSPNSLFVQVSLRIEHHVRSLNVFTFLLTFIVWLNTSIAIPLQLVTMPCIDNTMSELSVKDFLIA